MGKPSEILLEKISKDFYRCLEPSHYNGYRTLKITVSHNTTMRTDFVFLPATCIGEDLKDFIYSYVQDELRVVYNINDKTSLDKVYWLVINKINEEYYV